jgi:hypothetical protein
LERRVYVVVPAGLEGSFERRGIHWPWLGTRRDVRHNLDAAARQLTFRCHELMQALASFGVAARRLSTEETAQLWSTCLHSEMASSTLTASHSPVVTKRNRKEVSDHA